MKGMIKRITAVCMTFIILSVTPMNDIAPGKISQPGTARAAESDKGGKYISEVRIGMGETEEEAKNELEAEGFTILKDDSGNYANLNKDAGSKSIFKRGANDKIVYMGYKTTSDAADAITDLAVMNMDENKFSYKEYNILMQKQMDSQIKPFVERFVAALKEYRENHAKADSSAGYARAEYARKMLNKLYDDDTGKPMGDLLLNETKYELGDDAYNALSDEEKKEHADILTILMQANGQATLAMEKLITRATDASDDTWVDRFTGTTLDDLTQRVMDEKPGLKSKTDVMRELDKQYQDTAQKILAVWEGFSEETGSVDEKMDELGDTLANVNDFSDVDPEKMTDDERKELNDTTLELTKQAYNARTAVVCAYMDSVTYEGDTLTEFFGKDYSEVSSANGIRDLYPIVDSLSEGQIAGLDFLSISDMFSMAISDADAYKDLEKDTEDTEIASIYEGIDREIYKEGGVALTTDAVRSDSTSADPEPENYKLGTLPIILWSVTAGCAIASVASHAVHLRYANQLTALRGAENAIEDISSALKLLRETNETAVESLESLTQNLMSKLQPAHMMDQVAGVSLTNVAPSKLTGEARTLFYKFLQQRGIVAENNELIAGLEADLRNTQATAEDLSSKAGALTKNSAIARYLSIGMAVLAVILTTVATVMTVLDVQKFYDTEYVPIPRIMADRVKVDSYDKDGNPIAKEDRLAYYRVIKCNRAEGDSDITKKNYEIMKDSADLKGDIGRQWLALYGIKFEQGKPILADSLKYVISQDGVPDGYSTGIHEFGSVAACDLNKKIYVFPDDPPSIRVFFKTDDKTVRQIRETGSIFSPGSMAFGAGIGMIVGGLLVGLIMRRRRSVIKVS